MQRIAFVSNDLVAYRLPFFHRLIQVPGIELRVLFRTPEKPSSPSLPSSDCSNTLFDGQFISLSGGHIQDSLCIINTLKKFAPDVLVTDGFNVHQLCAFGYATIENLPHVSMTADTYTSVQATSSLRQAIRRFVYARSSAFVAASRGGQRIYDSYGISSARCFRSCLCIDNAAFAPRGMEDNRYDFIFYGRIGEVENPMFVLNVAAETALMLGRKVKLMLVGAGELEQRMHRAVALRDEFVEAKFVAFSSPEALPDLYRSARICLFPTLSDPWGMAVNEACAAGLPVILTPDAGAAGELVRDGENGFVCDLNVAYWAQSASLLLSQPDTWANFSARSLWLVDEYNYENAVNGLLDACRYAVDWRVHDQVGRPI